MEAVYCSESFWHSSMLLCFCSISATRTFEKKKKKNLFKALYLNLKIRHDFTSNLLFVQQISQSFAVFWFVFLRL